MPSDQKAPLHAALGQNIVTELGHEAFALITWDKPTSQPANQPISQLASQAHPSAGTWSACRPSEESGVAVQPQCAAGLGREIPFCSEIRSVHRFCNVQLELSFSTFERMLQVVGERGVPFSVHGLAEQAHHKSSALACVEMNVTETLRRLVIRIALGLEHVLFPPSELTSMLFLKMVCPSDIRGWSPVSVRHDHSSQNTCVEFCCIVFDCVTSRDFLQLHLEGRPCDMLGLFKCFLLFNTPTIVHQ